MAYYFIYLCASHILVHKLDYELNTEAKHEQDWRFCGVMSPQYSLRLDDMVLHLGLFQCLRATEL